jgi:uncharacterized protein (DUF58 family)
MTDSQSTVAVDGRTDSGDAADVADATDATDTESDPSVDSSGPDSPPDPDPDDHSTERTPETKTVAETETETETRADAAVSGLLDGVDLEAALGGDGDDATPAPVGETRKTYRLEAAVTASVVVAAVGMVTGTPAVLLASVVGVGWAAYARLSRAPEVHVGVEREVTPTRPAPGGTARVRLRLTNEGDRTVPDVRVVDRVPDDLAVVEGAARGATALRPGETATVEYGVRARRGEHELGPATVVVRGASGAVERVAERGGTTALTCGLPAETVPVSATASGRAGRVTTDAGGSGSEFHSTREYRPGDPMRRVDWNRLARTGELTTVEFDEERAASVVVTVDARSTIDRSPGSDRPGSVELSAYAAEETRRRLHAEGHSVGVAVLGDRGRIDWLAPDVGRDHRARLRNTLAAVETGGVGADAPTTRLSTRGSSTGRFSSSNGDDRDAESDGSAADDAPLAMLFDPVDAARQARTDGGERADGWTFGVDDSSDAAGETESQPTETADDAAAAWDPARNRNGTVDSEPTPTDTDSNAMTTTAADADAAPADATASTPETPPADGDGDGDADLGTSANSSRTTARHAAAAATETDTNEDPDVDADTDTDTDPDPDGDTDSTVESAVARELRRRLPASAQLVLFTPALDDQPIRAASQLHAFGHPVTVVSPDVTGTATAGGGVAGVERTRRLHELRRTGANAVDWAPDEPIELALARGVRRWSV